MRLANSTGGWLLPPRTAAVTLSLPSVKDPQTSFLQNNKNNNTRQPLRPSAPVRRGKKSKPVISESPGIFVISDSQRKELLKTPLVLHPATPVPVIPRPPTCRHHEQEAPASPKKVISCSSIPPTRLPPRPHSTKSVRPTGKYEEEKMSLLEQKRQQWAKEREELHGLWSPWGKTNANTLDPTNLKTSPYSHSGHNIDNNQSTSPGATVVTASYVAGLGLTTKASSSLAYPHNDVYLPPISGAEQIAPGGAGRRSTATTTTTSWAITNSNNMNNQENLRKSSLPNRMQSSYSTSQSLRRESHPVGGDGQHHQYYHPIISEDTPMVESRMRRGSVGTDNFYHHPEEEHNNNNSRRYLGDTEDYNITMERGSGRSPGRVIVHKIFMERGDSGEMDERMSRSLLMEPSSFAPSVGPAGDSNMANMKEREFGGSMGYIGLGKPPAPAMRSSLTIGLDPSYARSLEIIEKQEKEKWLAELEQQREEQRVRKLMEKDEKRARWGDRGIGVGHFWEPSDSATSRLPASSPYNPLAQNQQLEDEDNAMHPLSPSPPPWLERSLERMVTSKSLTNLRGEGDENTGDIEPYIGGAATTNRFINLSSCDLRKANGEGEGANEEKSFARGHNSLLDPDIKSEMEKKRQANHEHLEALRKQMEEKRMKQEEEKQKQLKEERDHEERMKKAAELDLERLKQEYRKQTGRSTDLDDFDQTANNHVVTTNDSMTEDADEDIPKHESPLIPHSADEGLPDAYELEIARRQSLLLTQKPSFTSTDDSGGKLQGSSSMMDLRQESKMVDQCLMTDSDHIYERTLTPTTERAERKRSASLGRSEFGTQTEQEEFSSGSGSRRGARKSRGEKVEEEKAKEEKPRWGANPVKKQYLKQSEKDPYYMQRLRKRNQRTRQGDSAGTDDSEEAHSGHQRSMESQSQSQGSSIPFSRIRSRKLSRSPVKTPMGPLKAIHGVKKTEGMKTQQIESHLAPTQRGLARNFPSDPQLNRKNVGKPPQIRKGMMNGIVRQSLGSISGLNSVGGSEGSGSGYTSPSIGPRNSLGSGGSDSLRSGSVHSPAMAEYVPTFSSDFIPMREFDEIPINAGKIAPGFRKTFGIEESTTSIPSMEEYTSGGKSSSGFRKSFGKEGSTTDEPSMQGFTSAGKSSSGIRKGFGKENSITSEPSMEEYASAAKSSSGFRTSFGKEGSILSAPSMEGFTSSSTTRNKRETSSVFTKRSAAKSESRTTERNTRSSSKSGKNKYESSELEEREDYQGDRLNSPPVPALMKKMQMGFHPDESGRLSSLPPDILSPLPPIKIGTPISMHSKTPSISDMRISSSVPKLDIDIAVTSSGNQDLQRLLETVREQARLSRDGVTTNSSDTAEDDELYEYHKEQYEEQEQEELYEETEQEDQYGEQEDQEEEQDEEDEEEEDFSSPREDDELPERFKLPGILPDPFPPVEMLTSRTLESDVSFNLQEEFINTLMSQKEVQEQLTAREKELCDKGIIEFNVRLPSRWAHRKNPLRCNSTSKILDDYKDPLASERRRNTASWLRNSDDTATESILNNLAALKQLST